MSETNYTQLLTRVLDDEVSKELSLLGKKDLARRLLNSFKDKDRSSNTRWSDQLELARLLTEYHEHTGYPIYSKDPKKIGVICGSSKLGDNEQLKKAVAMYSSFINRLPSDEQVFGILQKVYSKYKSTDDYMKRLVIQRLTEINERILNKEDTTRVMILKQFLSVFGFFEDTPHYTADFETYIRSQDKVFVDEEYNFSKITDKVFDVLSLSREDSEYFKSKLLNYLKYYGFVAPCNKEVYDKLAQIFDSTVLVGFDAHSENLTVADVFKIDLLELEPKHIKIDVDKEMFTVMEEYLKKEVSFSVLMQKCPVSYRISALCCDYKELSVSKDTVEQIRNILPSEYLLSSKNCKKLGDVVDCEKLKSINYKKARVLSDISGFSDLLLTLEKSTLTFDPTFKIKTSTNRLQKDAKYILSVTMKLLTEKLSLDESQKADIENSLTGALCDYDSPSALLSEVAEIIKKQLKSTVKTKKIKGLTNRAVADIIKSLFERINSSIYADCIYSIVFKRVKDLNKSLNEKTKVNGVSAATIKLLSSIDSLANGNFDDQGTTREWIYIFAIAFKMSCYTNGGMEILNRDTDLQLKLFYDIYSDNFVNRYKGCSSVVSGLSGYGINFKNFAELCFIYSIKHRGDKTSAEVLKEAYELIDSFVRKAALTKSGAAKSDLLTENYIDELSGVLNGPLENFVSYVEKNCDCKKSANITKNNSDTRTAIQLYKKLYQQVKEFEANLNYDLFMDISFESDVDADAIKSAKKTHLAYLCKNSDLYSDEVGCEFNLMLDKIADELKTVLYGVIENNLDLKDVTRTRFIALYYILITFLNMQKPKPKETKKAKAASLSDCGKTYDSAEGFYDSKDDDEDDDEDEIEEPLFEDFDSFYSYFKNSVTTLKIGDKSYEGLNECLLACGYQAFNPKSIYDVFVLLASYRDCYYSVMD